MDIAQTVDSALRILERISSVGPQSTAELGAFLGISKSSTYRLVRTLLSRNFLTRVDNGFFDIGPQLVELAELSDVEGPLRSQAWVDRLARETHETVLYVVRQGEFGVVERDASSDAHLLRAVFPTGYRFPINVSAAGKALLEADRAIAECATFAEAATGLVGRLVTSYGELKSGLTGTAAPLIVNGRAATIAVIYPNDRADSFSSVEGKLLDVQRLILARVAHQQV